MRLKPGARFPYTKASGMRSFSDIGRKAVALMDVKNGDLSMLIADKAIERTPLMPSLNKTLCCKRVPSRMLPSHWMMLSSRILQ